MRSQGADVAVLVTQALPKDLERFGEKDGVWVCSFAEARPLVQVLRDGIIGVSTALKSQENKGDKMHLLYNYLTPAAGISFQWQAVREVFRNMKQLIEDERRAMKEYSAEPGKTTRQSPAEFRLYHGID